MKDKLGREIKVGDFIVYGTLDGRSAALRIGKVLEIKDDNRITTIGIDDKRVWNNYPARLNSKVGYLQYSERIVVLDKKMVSEEYIKMLNSYKY